MPKKLLVAVRPGFSNTPAIERALSIAKTIDVDIKLYSAIYDAQLANLRLQDGQSLPDIRQTVLDSEENKLKEIKNRFDPVANSVDVQFEWHHSAAEGIINAAEQFEADLILLSSTQHSTFTRLFLTNTDWEVLRHASIPVLFAHHHPVSAYKKTMVAVDPIHPQNKSSDLDDRLIKTGQWLSDAFLGELHLVHAYPSGRSVVEIEYLPSLELVEEWRKEHHHATMQLASRHHIDDVHVHLIDEYPRIAISHTAKKLQADLVVIGVHSKSFLERMVLGHTAEYVLDHLECDVLTVPAINSGKPEKPGD